MSDASVSSTALERQIASQPDELGRLVSEPIPHNTIERLRQAHRIWLVGTGTSQHAAELGAMMLHDAGRAAHAVPSMHFVNHAPPIDPRDGVILISHNAGDETAFAAAAWTLAMDAGLRVVPITRRGGGLPEALETVDRETSHTYTVSYTAVLVLLARLAHELGASSLSPEALARVPDAVRAAIDAPGTQTISQPERLLVLTGEGPASVTAREGALKVREASRFPAEGYDVEYLLHGHAVPLNGSDHLVTLVPPDTQGLTAGVEDAARKAGVPVTRVEEPSDLPPLLAQIPLTVRLQLLALRYATERGTNPDVAIEGPWDDAELWRIGAPGT
jgi:glucosamine--fructose-6-phosphate aminotransferase (isomerizing)